MPPEWREQADEDLSAVFDECSTPNWDGEGAFPVDEATRETARVFLGALPGGVPQPEISADKDGEINFEWYLQPRQAFSVSLGKSGVLSFAGLFGRNTIHGKEEFHGEIHPVVLQQIDRLFAVPF